MITIAKPSDCCGCTACASICGHDAITMQPDALGFLYPHVDEDKCVDCGLCVKVCAFNDNYDRSLNLQNPIIYGARHKNMHEVETSRSGAVFIALSDWVLDNGGIVYGVGYKDHFRVAHKRATNKEERNEFKGSKYVQSDLTGVFRQVKDDLKNGFLVLFSGTPCQTSGLNSFVGNTLRKKLYLIDIVCHGVPSPYIWRDYLEYLEKKEKKQIISVNFRDKKFGWSAHRESFLFDNKYTYTYTYTYTFYQHIMFRHSCGVCHFTNLQRPSDITIADFWGWEKSDPNFNLDNKGCSLVLLNSEKGFNLFGIVKRLLTIIPVHIENCLQPNLLHPTIIHPKRMNFESDYIRKGFIYVMKHYGDIGVRFKLRRFYSRLKGVLKKILIKR